MVSSNTELIEPLAKIRKEINAGKRGKILPFPDLCQKSSQEPSIGQPKSRFRLRFIAAVSLFLAVSLMAKPVRAGIADLLGGTIFGNIYGELVKLFPEITAVDQWLSLIQNAVNDPCQSVPILFATPSEPGWCTTAKDIVGGKGSITSLLKGVVGESGIPDPAKARAQIQQKVLETGDTSDPFIINPESYGIQLGNLSDRVSTSLSVQTVLSDEGQKQMDDEIKQTSQVIQNVLNTSDEAQNYDSTQDVVKALARIFAQQSVITGMEYAASLKSRTDTQFTNLNLANISRSLDEQNRLSQAQATVDSQFLLRLTAQSHLF